MHEICLSLVWHQHQPYYPDDLTGENPMPWVRLHGTKDYWGMAMHLREVPEMKLTINLVPSLLQQILAYTEHGASDEHLRVSRLHADSLSEGDLQYLLDNFFMVHPEHNILPFRRYRELYDKRGFGIDSAERAAKRFSTQDIIDLQCWSNLAWIHPLAFVCDKDLAALREQGEHWTESEKQWLMDRQMDLLKQVIPLHKELAERGQIELTTTPFFHPILPLLWDKNLAKEAMPHVTLPRHLAGFPEDAVEQIRRGVDFHKRLFGIEPRGMWPSEGSVCQAMIPTLADVGIQWIATDEEILSCSTNGWVSRDEHGFLRHPEMLYRPWRAEEKGKSVQIVFRDHAMSDQIGFHYQRYPAKEAVDDFLGKLEAISHATGGKMADRPALATIVLDGENCWEYYPDSGVNFLRDLYQRVVKHKKIRPVRVADYLETHPASDRLGRVFSGSWISHNFGIWIGHPECNRAWDAVHTTRQHLLKASESGKNTREQLRRAWDELFIAEGSDWFWWFGDSHSSAQDGMFDQLFRKHLQNVYLALGDVPPDELANPIASSLPRQRPFTEPSGLLDVKIEGRSTYFEWIKAGRYNTSGPQGTMSMAEQGMIAEIHFGFDERQFYLRLDTNGGPVRDRLNHIDTLRIQFLKPAGFELLISRPAWEQPILQLYHNDVPVSEAGVSAATDEILEIGIPIKTLGLKPDDPLSFRTELIQNDHCTEVVPHEGSLEVTVPSPDFELVMWQA